MLGGQKFSVPTASEARKIFTDHTFLIDSTSTKLSKNITSKLRKCREYIAIFKNSSADGGLSEFWGLLPPSSPGRAIPEALNRCFYCSN